MQGQGNYGKCDFKLSCLEKVMENHYTRDQVLLQFFEDNFSIFEEERSGEEAVDTYAYLGSRSGGS